ncbi:zeta toxin family protein [Nocardia tengchongensis]|uniref:zeta toxin family protein n=1 Tax=Nocardia tengchongensis TaxID=2055889 RepID=UPI0033FE186D
MSTLVVIRGNSGSGKTTVANGVQQRFPRASCLVVPQDTVRRHMLRESDVPGAANIDLSFDETVRLDATCSLEAIVDRICNDIRVS